jgi:hypothetical protein
MPHVFHALAAQGQGMNPQHPMDPYIPLMPSLSLDSFFASYDEQNAAAQRAQVPPQLVENVLPAWEDLGNGQSGSLQAGADWRVSYPHFSFAPSTDKTANMQHSVAGLPYYCPFLQDLDNYLEYDASHALGAA